MFYADVFRVLATDLKDGVDCRIISNSSRGLCRDLISYRVGANEIAGQVSTRSGGSGGTYNYPFSHFFINLT